MFDQIQSALLGYVKQRVDARFSYVDELSELLHISKDSVYRRIRGETELSLKEALIICEAYNLSLHEILGGDSAIIAFQGNLVDRRTFGIYEWMQNILNRLTQLDQFKGNKELVYYTKDLPVFYYFNYPRLSAFKIYFWMRTIHRYPEHENSAFNFQSVPQEMITLGERIWNKFCQVPSTEIWALETTVVTLRQIEYYHDCGYFENPEDAIVILDEFEQLLQDAKKWMKAGRKPEGSTLQIYRNDILLGDNTILFKLEDQRIAFLPIGNLSIVSTSNARFCSHIEKFLETVIERAVQISSSGEKERNRYFNQNEKLIRELRNKLSH